MRISRERNALPEPLTLSPAKIGGIFQKAIECLRLPFAYKPLIYNTLFNVGFSKLQELYCGILTLLMQSEIITPKESPIAANPELVSQYKTRIPPDDTFGDDNTLELEGWDPNDYTISDMMLSDGTLDMGLTELIHHPVSAGKIPRKPIPATKIREELFEKDASAQLLYKLITHRQHNPTCKGFSNI